MNDLIGNIPKIDGAKSGLKEFVNFMSDQDQLGLTTFSSSADVLTPISPLGPKRQDILSRIDGINASGETLLFDTIGQQFQALQQFPSKHIKAIVVLTDGQDTKSSLKVGQLVNRVTASGEDAGEAIKIFTIAYGTDADTNALTQIASKTGGQEYSGTPQNIQEVYQQISEFF
jgi:Ca-activated chloride channel family protein